MDLLVVIILRIKDRFTRAMCAPIGRSTQSRMTTRSDIMVAFTRAMCYIKLSSCVTLQDGLLLILRSIDDFLRERNASSAKDIFVKNSEGCDVINNDIILEHIKVRDRKKRIYYVALV